MHIAIDVTPLESAHRARGTGVYTRLLVESLQKYQKDHQYSFISKNQPIPKDADVIHFPYFDPFFLTLPMFKPKPTVATVHDLIPIDYPSHFARGIRGEIKWQIQRISLGNVQRIITDSKASAESINKNVRYPKDKIDVVYLAPEKVFSRVTQKNTLSKVKNSYGLRHPFFLYVGDINWNKNIPGLLEAFAFFKTKNKTFDRVLLVCVGKAFKNDNLLEMKEIFRKIQELDLNPQEIIFTGFVPDLDLSALYSLALACVQPSFAEGFGFPVLEAMACGCPVIASGASSLAEIAGPAITVDPLDSENITKGMTEALALDLVPWRKKASAWVDKFSWEKVAKETMESYSKALLGEKSTL